MLATVGAIGVGVILAGFFVPHPRPTAPASSPVPRLSSLPDDPASAAAYLDGTIGNLPYITTADADILMQAVVGSGVKSVQKWGLVITGDRLNNATMTLPTRTALEELVKHAMTQPNWELRRTAIAAIDGTTLIKRKDVADLVRAMRDDPQQEVRDRAAIAQIDP